MKKHIPNILTLLNLTFGLLAIFLAVIRQLDLAVYAIMAGIFCDFFDGFAARLLKVEGELGKQLDSLADMVTSGVAPGIIWFQLISINLGYDFFATNSNWTSLGDVELIALPFLAFICPLCSAYRLAKFNIDTEQSNSFIGLPTPANALLIGGVVLLQDASPYLGISNMGNELWFIVGIGVLGCSLLNSSLPMFALKFKDYSWKNNSSVYLFLIACSLLLIALKLAGISFVILFYITYSLVKNTLNLT